jgi:hypothetical protein
LKTVFWRINQQKSIKMATSKILINTVVKEHLFNKHLTAVDLGKYMGLSNDAAYKLLKRVDWKISEIKTVGEFLKTNLFELFVSHQSEEEALNTQLKAKDEELNVLKQKFVLMEMENRHLKEMVELAKLKLKH